MAKPIDREAPAALESERLLLGILLLEPDQLLTVVDILTPGQRWFYLEAHHLIYDTILTLFERHDPIDLQSVTEVLHRRGHLEKVGGSVILAELLESVSTTVNTAYHANLIRDKFLYRSLINVGTQLTSSAYAQEELPAILAETHQSLLWVANAQTSGRLATMHDLMYQAIQHSHVVSGHELTGIDTGFADLNRPTRGFQASDLIILAARPGFGKTALALQFAVAAARMPQSATVLVCSLEMSKEQLAKRMLYAEARFSTERLRNLTHNSHEWGPLMNAGERLGTLPIVVDDTTSISVLDIRTRAKRLQLDQGLAMIIIDYVQLLSPGRRRDSRQQEVSEISRDLKILAKELHVPVLALSQLNRAVEGRSDRIPQLSDLRDSGALEQDADVVMFIYHPPSEADNPHQTVQLILAKQRNGPIDNINLIFNRSYARFDSSAEGIL